MTTPRRDAHHETRFIAPPSRLPSLNWAELYRSRELILVFVKRGLAVRYRQMALGMLWSLLEPLGLLVLTSLVFGMLMRVPTGPYPYPAFVFSALIPWLFFSRATNAAANGLLENMAIVSKVYFPRILLPIAAVIRELVDSLVLFVLLAGLVWFYGYPPTWRMALMPLAFLYLTIPALGIGLLVGSISIKFRDFRPLLALGLQAGFYVTPVFYPPGLVPERLRPIYELNPIYWGVEFTRWIILAKPVEFSPSLPLSLIVGTLLLAVGAMVFSYFERDVVDAQ